MDCLKNRTFKECERLGSYLLKLKGRPIARPFAISIEDFDRRNLCLFKLLA